MLVCGRDAVRDRGARALPCAHARPATTPQIVRPRPPEWEVEYKAWVEQVKLQRGYYKEYPASVSC